MKIILYTFSIFIFFIVTAKGETSNLKQEIIDKALETQFLSQKLVSNYAYHYYCLKSKASIRTEKINTEKLKDCLHFIARNTNNPNIKNILNFLSYSEIELETLLSKEPTKENLIDILDIATSIHEGGGAILKYCNYNGNKTKKMLIVSIIKEYMLKYILPERSDSLQLKKDIKKANHQLKHDPIWMTLKKIISLNDKVFIPHITIILIKSI